MTIKKWFRKKLAYLSGLKHDISWAFHWNVKQFVYGIKNFKSLRHRRVLIKNFLKKFQDAFYTPGERRPIKNCKHLKNSFSGNYSVRGTYKDYNLACHRFIDGRVKIWCLNGCGFVAWNGDPGFKEASDLFSQSTNTVTASELPFPSDTRVAVVTVLDSIPVIEEHTPLPECQHG